MKLSYDTDYGDEKMCECGHAYYRHFDTYDEMRHVGCKYCLCDTFKLKVGGKLHNVIGGLEKIEYSEGDGLSQMKRGHNQLCNRDVEIDVVKIFLTLIKDYDEVDVTRDIEELKSEYPDLWVDTKSLSKAISQGEVIKVKKISKIEKKTYKMVYDFLVYIENEADVDKCVKLTNTTGLSEVVVACNKYCAEIEKKYEFDPDMDREVDKWLR